MEKILAVLEEGANECIHAVTVIGHGAVCVERLLVDGNKLTPAVKAQLTTIVKDGEAIATAVVAAGSTDGTNWVADAAAVEAVRTFVADFLVALPVLKSAAETLALDVKGV